MVLINKVAPELITSAWLNTPSPISLADHRGRVIVIHAFQMLCPGCVSHGIPQAAKMHELFSTDKVLTIGLHSVFEHHEVMNQSALKAFIHEYRLSFPIAIDQPSSTGAIPKTMQLYALQGTPSVVIIDKNGLVRLNHFGRLDDMSVGSMIGELVNEDTKPVADDQQGSTQLETMQDGGAQTRGTQAQNTAETACNESGCPIDG